MLHCPENYSNVPHIQSYVSNEPLHFIVNSISKIESYVHTVIGLIISPLYENIHSTGADVAGEHRITGYGSSALQSRYTCHKVLSVGSECVGYNVPLETFQSFRWQRISIS